MARLQRLVVVEHAGVCVAAQGRARVDCFCTKRRDCQNRWGGSLKVCVSTQGWGGVHALIELGAFFMLMMCSLFKLGQGKAEGFGGLERKCMGLCGSRIDGIITQAQSWGGRFKHEQWCQWQHLPHTNCGCDKEGLQEGSAQVGQVRVACKGKLNKRGPGGRGRFGFCPPKPLKPYESMPDEENKGENKGCILQTMEAEKANVKRFSNQIAVGLFAWLMG